MKKNKQLLAGEYISELLDDVAHRYKKNLTKRSKYGKVRPEIPSTDNEEDQVNAFKRRNQ